LGVICNIVTRARSARGVEPVYPDNQVPAFEARERAFHGHALFGGTGFLGEGFGVDADGKRADLRPAAVDFAPIAAGDPARIGAHDAVAEIIGVALGLKTNDVIGPEGAQDSLIGGQSAGNFRPRPPLSSPIHQVASGLGLKDDIERRLSRPAHR